MLLDVKLKSKTDIILLQQPGGQRQGGLRANQRRRGEGKIDGGRSVTAQPGYSSGWTLIAESSWSRVLWLNLVLSKYPLPSFFRL